MPKRKQYSPGLKFQVAIQALQGGNATTVARQYGISHGLASRWKQQLLEHGPEIFQTTRDQELEKLKQHITDLEQLIGKKEVEINLLKNFLDVPTSPNGRS